MFHLFTHAFFKALLFLGAGSRHPRDDATSRTSAGMGGIWRKIPVTYAVMWIGIARAGRYPVLRRLLLEGCHPGGGLRRALRRSAFYAFVCGLIAAFLTAFYSWRLLILTFHGAPRADADTMAHVHESPAVMLVPLLAPGGWRRRRPASLFAPFFIGEHEQAFWNGAIFNRPRQAHDGAHA